MGLFDILGTIGSIATGVSTIFGTPSTGSTAATTGQTLAQQVAADPVKTQRVVVEATGAVPGAATRAAAMGASGASKVFTQTIVQRIDRETGVVLTEDIRKGTPWLMRTEVRALNRVTKAIRKADSKIVRKTAKVSDDRLRKAVFEDIQQLSMVQNLLNGHGVVKC